MKMYFSRIVADHWCAKNKSEEAAHKLAYELERRILKAGQVEAFKKEFLSNIDKIHAKYPRCKPLRWAIQSDPIDKGDITFWIRCISFRFNAGKRIIVMGAIKEFYHDEISQGQREAALERLKKYKGKKECDTCAHQDVCPQTPETMGSLCNKDYCDCFYPKQK
jgi:hypothetical protein